MEWEKFNSGLSDRFKASENKIRILNSSFNLNQVSLKEVEEKRTPFVAGA
jgi:hypothetical protein